MKRNQSGFAHLALFIGLIVVVVIGVAGYFVWQSQQAKNKTSISNYQECVAAGGNVLKSSPAQCVKDNKTFTKVETSNSAKITNFDECVAAGNPVMESYPEQCSADGKTYTNSEKVAEQYLTIKEWGVKFRIPSGLSSMKYSNYIDGISSESFELDSSDLLKKAGGDKYCNDAGGYLGVLSRQKTIEGTIEANVVTDKIGGYYYTYSTPQDACLPNDYDESAHPNGDSNHYPSSDLQSKASEQLVKTIAKTLTAI